MSSKLDMPSSSRQVSDCPKHLSSQEPHVEPPHHLGKGSEGIVVDMDGSLHPQLDVNKSKGNISIPQEVENGLVLCKTKDGNSSSLAIFPQDFMNISPNVTSIQGEDSFSP